MQYRQVLPAENLSPYIRCFGLLESDDTCPQPATFKVVADGCPGLIFQENLQGFFDENNNAFPQLYLHGLTTRHSQKTTQGPYRNVAVYFRPHALKTIFGIEANELTNRHTALDAVVKSHLTEQLLHEPRTGKRIEILSTFISRQVEQNRHRKSCRTVWMMEKIKAAGENGLHTVRAAEELSERSLERMFKAGIGVSPKLFFRIHRFQAALADLRHQRFTSLTELAYRHSYADQSHHIREFKEFAGTTPRQFLLHANEQVENFPEWRE